jgi:uncharacterized protein YdeI (YjbR/CyaY-like superfamily)
MTEWGMAKITEAKQSGEWRKKKGEEAPVMAPDVKRALARDGKARENFNRFTPSHQKQCLGWIESAKKKETRNRRIQEVVRLASLNKKLGMK